MSDVRTQPRSWFQSRQHVGLLADFVVRQHAQSTNRESTIRGTAWATLCVALLLADSRVWAIESAAPTFSVEERADRIVVSAGQKPIGEFVWNDERIRRPYWANLRAPSGLQVTRRHPPVAGEDATDHDTMHPGLWLGFGELSGSDFWRNKGRIGPTRWSAPPRAVDQRLEFAIESELTSHSGETLGRMASQFLLAQRPLGYLLVWRAKFQPLGADLRFGDQEEMGFGARIATPLTEKAGGLIRSSTGRSTAAKTWGQPARWCDYSGRIDGRPAGITLCAAPGNFRESWWHNRDYGVFVANPFGRSALRQGEKSEVVVRAGESLELEFAAWLHDADAYDPARAYEDYLDLRRADAPRP